MGRTTKTSSWGMHSIRRFEQVQRIVLVKAWLVKQDHDIINIISEETVIYLQRGFCSQEDGDYR